MFQRFARASTMHRVARMATRQALRSTQKIGSLGGSASRFQSRGVLSAHGPSGKLAENMVPKSSPRYQQLVDEAKTLRKVELSKRQACDVELVLNGGFSPLTGFMTKAEYDGCVEKMRLPDGTLFPMPITLDVDEGAAKVGERIAITFDDVLVGVMSVSDVWTPDKSVEAEKVFGGDAEHPAIKFLNEETKNTFVGGKIEGLNYPEHYDYVGLRKTPAELRKQFIDAGHDKVVAFQTRNPIHRAHYELTLAALATDPNYHLLVHPVVGMTKSGDIDHHTRMKCYGQIMPQYPEGRASLSVYPLAMRMGGPREAIWHAIIRKNYGATAFIVGRDHAGPGSNSKGDDFYGAYDARDQLKALEGELGMDIQSYEMMVYVERDDKYYPIDNVPEGAEFKKLSGTKLRGLLAEGAPIPEWFSFKPVVDILRTSRKPAWDQGVGIALKGGDQKAREKLGAALQDKFMELSTKAVSLYKQGGVADTGFVTSEVVKNGGLAIDTTSPSDTSGTRDTITKGNYGAFLEVGLGSSSGDLSVDPNDRHAAIDKIVSELQSKKFLTK